MKKFVLAPVLAALAMFVWGFIYWGLPHHLPYKSAGHLDDESATAMALGTLFPASGFYLLPSPLSGEAKVAELLKRGPMAQVFIVKESTNAMDPAVMLKGFLHMLVLAVMLTGMLCGLAKSFETVRCRVLCCASLGLLVAVCDLGNAIWWHHPWGWTLAGAIYTLTMFTLAGLVLAKFVTPKAAAVAA